MAEPSSAPSSSSSPPSERLSEDPLPILLESLEHQGFEIRTVLSIQPLSSLPPPTSDTGSPTDIGPKSLDNPVQTPESSPTTDGQFGLVIYPLNPLFDPVVISLYHL